jgi:arylsulfatase A-like enzyme
MVVADDLDTHELGCYGGRNVATPHLDKLAAEGMLFKRMYTPQAMCAPTRAALYTGLHPMHSGVVRNHASTKKEVKSVVQYLSDLGYRVGIAGKTHVYPASVYPFEYVEGFPKGSMRKAEDETYDLKGIRSFMTRDPEQPFCLFVCSSMPHAPYVVGDASKFDPARLILQPHWVDTPETRREFRDYLAEVAALDQQVGDVLQVLEEARLTEKTLALFSGEQGSGFPGAKWSCYNAGVRSGFIARLPGKIKGAAQTEALVMCEDLVPTLIELAGGQPPPELDGRSFLGVLLGRDSRLRDYAYGMCNMLSDGRPYPSRFIVSPNYKLIANFTPEKPYTNPHALHEPWRSWLLLSKKDQAARKLVDRLIRRPAVQMFDLQKDPWELENVAERPELAQTKQELEVQLQDWMKEQADPGAELDNMTEEQMRQLWPGRRAAAEKIRRTEKMVDKLIKLQSE